MSRQVQNTQSSGDETEISIVSRYRLNLVREGAISYEAAPCGDAASAARLAHDILLGYDREAMGAILVDCRNRAIGFTVAYVGTLCRTAVEPRGLLVPALLANAYGIVIFHNHPSGDPSPSVEDLVFTRLVAGACDAIGLRLVDHIILGESPGFVSLKTRHAW